MRPSSSQCQSICIQGVWDTSISSHSSLTLSTQCRSLPGASLSKHCTEILLTDPRPRRTCATMKRNPNDVSSWKSRQIMETPGGFEQKVQLPGDSKVVPFVCLLCFLSRARRCYTKRHYIGVSRYRSAHPGLGIASHSFPAARPKTWPKPQPRAGHRSST